MQSVFVHRKLESIPDWIMISGSVIFKEFSGTRSVQELSKLPESLTPSESFSVPELSRVPEEVSTGAIHEWIVRIRSEKILESVLLTIRKRTL